MRIPNAGMRMNGPSGPDTLVLTGDPMGGAFGFVFRAEDTVSGAVYAVKFPKSIVLPYIGAFLNEVQAAKTIRHPNVVTYHYVEDNPVNTAPYIVMDFVSGGTLQDRINSLLESGTTLDIHTLGELTRSLVDGISAINLKMLHTDLKPDNILMDGDTPKITDFGISKVIGEMTRSFTFKGGQHILYMAPEGWKGETNAIQLDMYAMGIVLFLLASLEYPYQQPANLDNMQNVMDMHLFAIPKSLSSIRPGLPLVFIQMVDRMLEKNPRDRFADWMDVKRIVSQVFGDSRQSAPNQQIGAIMEAMQRRQNAARQNELLQQREQDAGSRDRKFGVTQWFNLHKRLKASIDEFNTHSPLHQITIQNKRPPMVNGPATDPNTDSFIIPHGGVLQMGYAWLREPLQLKRGTVRLVAWLKDGEGRGLNYLLCQKGLQDLYGSWVACRATRSPLVHPSKFSQRVEPFGFYSLDEMKNIEDADRAMHIYQIQYIEDIGTAFFSLVEEIM